MQRVEITTQDMDVIADLISQQYVEHRAKFRCADPARVDASAQSVTAGLLKAGVVRCKTSITRPGSVTRTAIS